MKIWEYLKDENIFLDISVPDKNSALRFIADISVQNGIVKNASTLYEGLEAREQTMSTGVGGGIAFPHTTTEEAEDTAVLLIRLTDPVAFEALDELPVDIVIAIVIPETQTALHIQILARLSMLCKNSEFLKAVRNADDSRQLWEEMKNLEEKCTC